jgi:hypothetical protein
MRNDAPQTINTSPFPAFVNSALLVSLIIFFATLLLAWNDIYISHVDNAHYIQVANGEQAVKPFSQRIIFPKLAYIIHMISGLNLHHSFGLCNTIALMLFISSVTVIIKSITSCAAIAIPLLLTPYLIRSYSLVFLPDLFAACLTGLFFYLIYRSYFWPSLVVLLLVYLTRENAIFLCISLAVLGFYKHRLRWTVASLSVLVTGIIMTSIAGRLGQPQPYEMNQLVFYALKIPKNFVYNVFGVLIWTNVYADVGNPYFLIALPGWLPLGNLHTIGITPMQPLVSLNTIMVFLTTFGVAPSLLTMALVKNWRQIFSEGQFWLQIAIIYGMISFLMGIMVSYDVMRLIGYAWPAFWLAVPCLLKRYANLNRSSLVKLLFLNAVTCWLPWIMQIPWFVDKVTMDSAMPFIVVIFISILINFYVARMVSNRYISFAA